MDGEVIDLDLTDVEDADPNFQPEETIQRVQSSSDNDSELELPRVVLADSLRCIATVSPAQQVAQAADTLLLVANVTPAPQVIQPAQTAPYQTAKQGFFEKPNWIEYRRDQRALRTRKKDILDSMKFKDEYAEFLIHVHRNEDSEDSDTNYTCVMPKPIKQPRIAHPPDVLRTKNTLHLPDIPSPSSKPRCRFPGCSSNKARIRRATCKVFLCIQETRNCFKLYHEL
ncbi:hypothetical protein J6590_063076 [Homalodisca vitripennis]|nr:hypothetical protein J6590_063076 [Homalodisca vitripennis]